MKSSILFFLCFGAAGAGAQGGYDKKEFNTLSGSMFLTTITGEPIKTGKYVQLVEGTPFFRDQWMQGIVVLQDGTRTHSKHTKMNLLEGEIYYQDSKGREMVVAEPVQEVLLMNKAEDSVFRFVHASMLDKSVKKGWYLLLQRGKASLFKYYQKDFFETKNYGSASAEQRVTTKEKYSLLVNGSLLPVKNIKELSLILKEKKSEMESMINKLPGNGATEDKMITAITYYNSLPSN